MTLRGLFLASLLLCFTHNAAGQTESSTQSSTGPCSPNIANVGGDVNFHCYVLEVTDKVLAAIGERDKALAEKRMLEQQLSQQERLSEEERHQLQARLVAKDAELSAKVAQVQELEVKYRQLAETLRRSEEAKTLTVRQLKRVSQTAQALDLTVAAARLDTRPEEHRHALTLLLQAMEVEFSYQTATAALRELLSLSGPPLRPIHLGFNDAGTRIVAVTEAHELLLWDVATGRLVGSAFADEELAVNGVFRPQNRDVIITVTRSGTVRVWSASTLEMLSLFSTLDTPNALRESALRGDEGFRHRSVSNDGHIFAEAADGRIDVWDLRAGRKIAKLSPKHNVLELALSDSGNVIASCGFPFKIDVKKPPRNTVEIWNLRNPSRQRNRRLNCVEMMGGAADSVYAVIRDGDRADLWDLTAGSRILIFESKRVFGAEARWMSGLLYPNFFLNSSGPDLVFNRIGERQAFLRLFSFKGFQIDRLGRRVVQSDGFLTQVFDIEAGRYLELGSGIHFGTFSKSGEFFAGFTGTSLAAWRIEDGTPVWHHRFHLSNSRSTVSQYGAAVRLLGNLWRPADLPARVDQKSIDLIPLHGWNVINGNTLAGGDRMVDALSRNGRFLLRCPDFESCEVVHYPSMALAAQFKPGRSTPFFSSTWIVSDDGQQVLAPPDDDQAELRVITVTGGSASLTLPQRATAISASGDFRQIALGYPDGTAELVELPSMSRHTLPTSGSPIQSLDFSRDGSLLAGGSEDGMLVLWDSRLRVRSDLIKLSQPISMVRLSDSGRLLAAGTTPESELARGNVSLWDIDKSAERLAFRMSNGIRSLGFGVDEQFLIAEDGLGPIWAPITRESIGKALCALLVPSRNVEGVAETAAREFCSTLEP